MTGKTPRAPTKECICVQHMRRPGDDPESTYERMHIHAAYTMTGRDPESTYERMHMRAAYAMTGRDPESPQAAANPTPGADQKRRHDGGNMTTTPVPVILGPCAPLSNLRSSDRSWWDHTMRGRRHGRPTLFPGGGPHDDIPPHTLDVISPPRGWVHCDAPTLFRSPQMAEQG